MPDQENDEYVISPEETKQLKRICLEMLAAHANRKAEDFKINPEQLATITRLARMLESHGARIDGLTFPDDEPDGNLSVAAPEVTLNGEELHEFCELLKKCVRLNFLANMSEEAILEFVVPDVHIEKSERQTDD